MRWLRGPSGLCGEFRGEKDARQKTEQYWNPTWRDDERRTESAHDVDGRIAREPKSE